MSNKSATAGPVKVNATGKFAVVDLAGLKVEHVSKETKKREQSRANKEHGQRIQKKGELIGGVYDPNAVGSYQAERIEVFERLWAKYNEESAKRGQQPIKISLPDGTVKQGTAFKTTPMDIAKEISQGLADNVVVAKVVYSNRLEEQNIVACDEDDEAHENKATTEDGGAKEGELWDLSRPLVGDCVLTLLKYDSPEASVVFSHSSAHVLGAAIEATFGAHLTIGPPLQQGFYYDSFMGERTVGDEDLKKVEAKAQDFIKGKHAFQRLVLSKEQALEMFRSNPFKAALIRNKVPEGSQTTVYRCGPLIDLCMGPHVPHTGKIKAFAATKSSSTNWLGQTDNDPLQRIYGIAFPDKAMLKKWQEFQEQAKQRDHRVVGAKQELFFFHQLSPGSCFWMPHGARVYNKLMDFIRKQYWVRGYTEVITPNIFNLQLWEISGHAQLYKENMFTFDVEEAEWGMKPMNCPAHCLMFAHRLRSYRELPLRIADFGVLHRNELSGALTGLTRVRRFQQDDGHIFCRQDQIKQEVLGALDFMRFVYTVLGKSSLCLGTQALVTRHLLLPRRYFRHDLQAGAVHAAREGAGRARAVGQGGGAARRGPGRVRGPGAVEGEPRGRRLLRTQDRHQGNVRCYGSAV
jgi:threonyl-tRNA synthetase